MSQKRKTRNRKATERAKDAVAKIVVTRGQMGKALRSAGYSESYARNPHQFLATKAIQEDVSEVLSILKKGRTRAFKEAVSPKKLKRASAYTAALTGDILVKNERLFEGKATEVIGHQFDQMNDDELDSKLAQLEGRIRRSTGGKR